MILRGRQLPDLIRTETLADILEASALRLPEHIAIEWQGVQLTYAELNQQADSAAHHLIQLGIRTGDIIGLCLPRGARLLIMQAAIAKAGAAWLPFESDTPPERMQVCLDDANAAAFITETAFAEINTRQCLVADLQQVVTGDLSRRQDLQPSHPAYVIYTSGSTGKPKGVPISQGSICHFLRSENAILGIHQGDKVYQGFSVAFDMSFEEIWISYLVGATLWIAPKILTGDPDALPSELNRNRVTVLHAVPTLLALFSQDVPSLRLINLGGEMCPSSLVDRWATPERQMFNTYGPTECTVSASLAQLRRGDPVTIGTPLPNYGLLVRSEDGRLLDQGETGELCIIGPGVADGYLGRPDLTAEKFIPNPFSDFAQESRLYRTGDLARIDENSQIQCLGRTDDQVKVRGFRVELGEIEAALCKIDGVSTAVVLLRPLGALEQLVAFITTEVGISLEPSELKTQLRIHLPPYMIPAQFEFIAELPRLTSGKIDRKTLRTRALSVPAQNGDSDEPISDAEKVLFESLSDLFPNQVLRLADDFFADLGGHSLLAACLISSLRGRPAYAGITVQDVYQSRTLHAIASRLDVLALAHQSEEIHPEITRKTVPAFRRLSCGIAQLACLPFLIGLRMLLWLAPFFTYHFMTGDEGDSFTLAIAASVLVYLLSLLASFAISIAGKWLILGHLKAGRYPLYGLRYFRWWLVDRLFDAVPSYFLFGSPLQSLYLRAMGAKIGSNVTIATANIRVYDLLTIADGVSIGSAVNFENFRVIDDEWEVGEISIGAEAYIGSYCILQSDVKVGRNARLEGLSALSSGQVVPCGEIWAGSPALPQRDTIAPELPPRPERSNKLFAGLAYAAGSAFVAILFFVPIFPSFLLIDWLDSHWLDLTESGVALPEAFMFYFLLALPASAALILVTLLGSALMRLILLPKQPVGRWPVFGIMHYRRWLTNQIQESSLQILHGLYASIYAGWWYRLLGANVGKGTEISNAIGVAPDLLTLGQDSFIADAVMLGDEEIDRGWMILQKTLVGNRSFVGNGAYVPQGCVIPDDVLIGVQSHTPENAKMKSGQTWLGSPAIALPAREQVAGFAENLTFRPSLARRIARGIVEGLRTVTPLALIITFGYLTVLKVMPLAENEDFYGVFWALMMAGIVFGVISFMFIVILKWLFIGRYVPRSAPMWTSFVWRSEAITSLYESIAVPNFFNFLRGTPFLPMALRCMGCKIGHNVFIDSTDVTEFDCVSIGNNTVIHAWSGPQTHLFEDRIMKIGRVDIGSDVSIGSRSTILYSAKVGDGARLGPLTLVMKGENIPAQQSWTGSPAQPWRSCRE